MNIGLSYAKKFTDNISCGATVRMISESIPDLNASGVALDAGVQYVSGDQRQIKFGISLKNVGPKCNLLEMVMTLPTQIQMPMAKISL